ncbi:MAG: pyruvate formate lyase-activating protein [Lachnospiraceae bacterium]|nr:pyruvate formate lyase-activating protein [Lachnospiraceae bacterium]
MVGYIHSTETLGTVDGPGRRYVVFFQGCPMRCLYCHNPDTWAIGGPNSGRQMTAEELLAEYDSGKEFYTNGGITCTGGEPMFQIDFLTELFMKARAKGIHTCLDTSGITFNRANTAYLKKVDELLKYTSLVMLDIKEIDNDMHIKLTGHPNTNILDFARYLSEKEVPVWIRHVIVQGYTQDKEEQARLGEFLATLHNVKALDCLPYHTMGKNKYDNMGIKYPLEGLPALTDNDAIEARNNIIAAWKVKKAELNALEAANKQE